VQLSFINNVFSKRQSLLFLALSVLFLVVFNPSALASSININENINVKHLTTADGLSQSYIYDLIEDSNGLIWIATQDGLDVYNGKNFKSYRNDINNEYSLADNIVRKLFIDHQNTIWVGTQNGLSQYDRKLDRFINHKSAISSSYSLSDNIIWDIYEDKNQQLWVTTETGIHKYDDENRSFMKVNIRRLSDNTLIHLKEIKTIFQDENNNYWLGSFDQGFYIVNDNLLLDTTIQKKIQEQLGPKTTKINQIKFQSKDNTYWLATNNGVFVLDKNYQLIKRHFTENGSDSLIESRAIILSYNSDVWVATDEGLKSINPLEDKTQSYSYDNILVSENNKVTFSLLQDSHNRLWIGSSSGLIIYDSESNLIKKVHSFGNSKIKDIVRVLAHNDEIWFTDAYQLFNLNLKSHSLSLKATFNTPIFQIKKHRENLLLFSQDNRLLIFDISTQSIKENTNWKSNTTINQFKRTFIYSDQIWFLNDDKQLSSFDINTDKITIFEKDNILFNSLFLEDNKIWLISSDNSIQVFDLNLKGFNEFPLINNTNYVISNSTTIKLSKNSIALGSDSYGLLLIDKQTKQSKLINEATNLANNFVADIVVDKSDNFWISTNKGISAILANDNKVQSFNKDHYLQNNEFLSLSSAIDMNGIVYFGGTNGLFLFNPEVLLTSQQNLNAPILTSLLVANKNIEISQQPKRNKLTIDRHINNMDVITLSYFHSPFSFEFISPNAKFPNQVSYRYKLIGNDQNWLETDSNNLRATYTNLNAGDYVFTIEASDSYQPSLKVAKSINVHILPPWWLSNSAVLIYTIVTLLILAYLLQQFRHKRLYHLQIKASEERLKLSLWGSGDEMWDWNIKRGKIYRSNIWGILDFPQDGKRNLGNDGDNETNVNQNDIARIRKALDEHFDDKTEHFEATYRVKDKNEKWIWVLDRGKIVERDDKNRPTRMTGTLKDISHIKKADERLKLFAKCIENISDAVVIYDRKFTIVDVNKAYQRITGRTKRQMVGKSLKFTQYPETFTQDVKKHLITKGSWHGEIESKRDNNDDYLTDLNIDIIRDDNNSISHFVGVFSDITKRKETEEELRKLANTDTLTELPNRSFFQAHQTHLVKKKVPHALLVFDLDNFKKVNDSMGHEVGDILLCKVADRLRSIGRQHDSIYRLGGDEFSLIVEDTNDIHTITSIAKHILRTIAEPLKLKNHEIVLYSSIGIVLYPEDGVNSHDLLKNADTAMYHAKHSGGNQYDFFNATMNEQAVKRLQIEGLIRHGLKEDYFSVFYQPKIEIATGKVAGMEALVRFETPSKGIISPVVFIPVSEETGQIIDIGEVVLRKACYATKEWINAELFDGRIAVNLSAVQFTQPNLVGMIEGILKETQLPARYLELEITEGTVMDSPQKAIDTMHQIRAMGIHLSLDDFGTGYSSLAYLKKFPLNTLKIDKAFVDDIETSEQGRNMVATIVTIAHNLGLQVVAEGVETNQQLSFLSGLRCEQLQGYLYSKPLPQKDFSSYLLSHQITTRSTSFNKY